MKCPNKTYKSYKALSEFFTEKEIYGMFIANEYTLPSEEEVERIILNKKQEDISLTPKTISPGGLVLMENLLNNQTEFIKDLGVDRTLSLVNFGYNRAVAAIESGTSFHDAMVLVKGGLTVNMNKLKELYEKNIKDKTNLKDKEKIEKGVLEGINRFETAIDNWDKIESLIRQELDKTKGIEVDSLDEASAKGQVYDKDAYEIDPKINLSAKLKILLSGFLKTNPKAVEIAKSRYIQKRIAEGKPEEASLNEKLAKAEIEKMSELSLYNLLEKANEKFTPTWFGEYELINYVQAYKNLLPILQGLPEDIDIMIETLEKESKNQVWLTQVVEKLKTLDDQTKRQFASEMTKHQVNMRYVQISTKRTVIDGKNYEFYTTYVRNSNSNEISDMIHKTWESNFIESGILIPSEDDYIVSENMYLELDKLYFQLQKELRKVTEVDNVQEFNYENYKEKIAELNQDFIPYVVVGRKKQKHVISDTGELIPYVSTNETNVQTVMDFYSRFGIVLSEKTAKGLLYGSTLVNAIQNAKYLLDAIGDNINKKYFEDNVHIIDNQIVKDLAKAEARNAGLKAFHPDNFRTQGKQIYAYTLKSFITERGEALMTDDELVTNLLKTQYAGNSQMLLYFKKGTEEYNSELGSRLRRNFVIADFDLQTIKDLQQTIRWGDQRFTRIDEVSQEIAALHLFVNSNTKYTDNQRIAQFVAPTFSDKTRAAIVPLIATKAEYDYENKTIGDKAIDRLFDVVVMPEILRIAEWIINSERGFNHKQYNKGGMFFYHFPQLNEMVYNGKSLFNIIKEQVEVDEFDVDNIKNFGFLDEGVVDSIKQYVKNYVNEAINEKIETWTDYEIVNENKNFKLDLRYLESLIGRPIKTRKDLAESIYAFAADYKVNDIIAKAEMHYMFIGDPALMYKGSKPDEKNVIKGIQENAPISIASTMNETYGNIGKRLALEIATRKKFSGNKTEKYMQLMLQDPTLMSTTIKYLAVLFDGKTFDVDAYINMTDEQQKEYLKNYPNAVEFAKIDGADAQEVTTMSEWLHIQNRFGLTDYSEEDFNKIIEIENKENPTTDEINTLRKFITDISKNPQKPVYSGQIYNEELNIMDIVYVKSSAFPLSRHLTKDFQIDNLRIVMEELEKREGMFVRASFESGIKLGSVPQPLQVFDNLGNVRSTEDMLKDIDDVIKVDTDEELGKTKKLPYKILDRANFGIQQDMPFKEKPYIKRGTQETKLLWTNIIKEPSVKDLYDEFLKLHEEIYDEQRKQLYEELGINQNIPLDNQSINIEKLSELLKKEAKQRGYPLQDTRGLDLVDGQFLIPLMFHASSNRYESLLNSIINNRILKIEMPGNGNILGSSEGFKLKEAEGYTIPSGTVLVEGFDGNLTNSHFIEKATGKQITKRIELYRPEEIEFVPAKVLVPFKLMHNKKLLKLQDYTKVGNDGKLYLDTTKFPKELLKQFGFRIPTSGQMSMATMQIVGFLPEDYKDLIIAPRDFVKQMGSDFDVDKLMTYWYEINVSENGVITKANTKKNRIIDIHHEVLSMKNSNVQIQVMKPLSFDEAKAQAALITKNKKMYSLLDDEFQKLKRISGSSGKAGTGWYSLATTFHATAQLLDKPIQVMKYNPEKDRMEPYRLVIAGYTSYGKLGGIKTLDGQRYISDVHLQRQNYSMDNAKEELMFTLNDNNYTFHFSTFLDELGFDFIYVEDRQGVINPETGKFPTVKISIVDFLRTQPIIQEYVKLRNLDKSHPEAIEALTKSFTEIDKKEYENFEEAVKYSSFGQTLYDNMSADNPVKQGAVLALFEEAMSFGDGMSKVMTTFNTDSAGLDKSIFDNIDKLEKVEDLEEYRMFTNLEEIKKNTINGLATEYGLNTSRIFNKIFPYHKMTGIFDKISKALSLPELPVDTKQEIAREFRKYIFASHLIQNLEEGATVEDLRKELFFQTDSNMSLAKYDKQLKELGLLNNTIFSLMSFEVNSNELPSTIMWNNSVREENENKYYFDWLSMFLNTTELPIKYNGRTMTYQSLAQLHVLYAYLEGGIQEVTQFVKHVPIEYLISNNFAENLRKINIDDDFINQDAFVRQYIQHNPMGIKAKIRYDDLNKNIEGNVNKAFNLVSFELNNETTRKYLLEYNGLPPYIRIYDAGSFIKNKKVRKKGSVLLFALMNDGKYYRIPVLGIHGMNEYNFDKTSLQKSMINTYNANTIYNRVIPTDKDYRKSLSIYGLDKNTGNTVSKALEGVARSGNSYYKKLAEFYLKNYGNLGNIILKIIDDTVEGVESPGRGWYNERTNTITLSRTQLDKLTKEGKSYDIEKLILHEVSHAFTVKYFEGDRIDYNKVPEVLVEHFKKLERLFDIVKQQYPNRDQFIKEFKEKGVVTEEQLDDIYGSYNMKEFFSVIMTSEKLQERLSKVKSGETSLWSRISRVIRDIILDLLDFIGFNRDSVTGEAISSIVEIISYKPDSEIQNIEERIYRDLPYITGVGNVVIFGENDIPEFRDDEGKIEYDNAIQYAEDNDMIYSLRKDGMAHYGNPFTPNRKLTKLIQVKNTKEAVEKYIKWILTGQINDTIPETMSIESLNIQREWMINQFMSGELKGKPILYYVELNQPSHANALDYLINKFDWSNFNMTTQPVQPTQPPTEEIIGIEINSKETGLGNDLTNVHYAKDGKSKYDIEPSNKTLTLTLQAKNTWGKSVEAWYKSNNAKVKGIPEGAEGDLYDMNLMVGLITDKLTQYPDLVSQITERGGLEFLDKSTHTMGTGRWSSNNPKNMFINALKQAYQNVTSTQPTTTTDNQLSNITTQSLTQTIKDGFQGYKGGFEDKGKGTPEGDGKDKAMRKIADGYIGEIAEWADEDSVYWTSDEKYKPKTSSSTSALKIAKKNGVGVEDVRNNTTVVTSNYDAKNLIYEFSKESGEEIVRNARIMLSRNSEFKGQPLKSETKKVILDNFNKGAEFVVGDMPGVDSQFIDYLQEIGAKFTIYHTGTESRIKITQPTTEKTTPSATQTTSIEPGQYVIYQNETYIVTKSTGTNTVQIYNPTKEGVNAKKNVALKNLTPTNNKAVIVNYSKNNIDYIVTPKNTIISLQSNKIQNWGDENGDRKAIIKLANEKRNITPPSVQPTQPVIQPQPEKVEVKRGKGKKSFDEIIESDAPLKSESREEFFEDFSTKGLESIIEEELNIPFDDFNDLPTGEYEDEITLTPIIIQGLPEIVVDLRQPSRCQ